MFPKLFSAGSFFLPTYGLLVSIAFLVALWLTARLAKRAGLDPEAITNLGVYVALSGLAGAKLMMVIYDFDYYRSNPREIFSLSTLQAGGVFYGGLIAALVVAFFYMRSKHLPPLGTADLFAPGLALGHAIGRLGCFAAGCCWGRETHLPWAVTFTNPDAHALVGVPLGIPLHPTQIYEAIAEFVIFWVLYRQIRRPHREGQIIGLYLILYPAARFAIEFVRAHEQANPFGLPLSASQWIAAALIVAGIWAVRSKRGTGLQPVQSTA
jgi:phosphatidylglycerol---prolipoprotein diacylglyceryl transferase